VATLIDRSLAEKWIADHKNGAVNYTEDTFFGSKA
jgi:hypothetical protein